MGQLLHYQFRGLLSVHSCYNLQTRRIARRPSTSKAPTASLPPPPLRLLPGGAIQFPGGSFLPLWFSAFHGAPKLIRSEEHTPELQSLRHLVCRLLLEKIS